MRDKMAFSHTVPFPLNHYNKIKNATKKSRETNILTNVVYVTLFFDKSQKSTS